MNRYFLVVTPGLERLLYREIKGYIPRINATSIHPYFTTGGLELKCIHTNYINHSISIERRVLNSDFKI